MSGKNLQSSTSKTDREMAEYGRSDLDLGHGFHATKQGERYTLSEPAHRTVLDRLLQLNHQRYAEEVAAGLHVKVAKKNQGQKAERGPREVFVRIILWK